MDGGDNSALPYCFIPKHFPAKLWLLVNNPQNNGISWDSLGEGIIIDQQLFETQILSPCNATSERTVAFKTIHFSSFVRQLNLYGFKKTDQSNQDNKNGMDRSGKYHHFCNPLFKRNHPELVGNLKRLTAENIAKLEAGQDIRSQPARKTRRLEWERSTQRSHTHQESNLAYFTKQGQAGTEHDGAPVSPQYLISRAAAPLSPFIAADKGVPGRLSGHYAGVSSSTSAMQVQQGLLVQPNPGKAHQPSFLSPACQCMYFGASQMTFNVPQNGLFHPYNLNQGGYPAKIFGGGDQNWSSQYNAVNQEVKKYDIDVDTIFQVANELTLPPPPTRWLVHDASPEKPVPVLVDSPKIIKTTKVKCSPLDIGPIITSVSDEVNLAKFSTPEESVVLTPEHLPKDPLTEVTSEDAKDTEVIPVVVSDTVRDYSPSDAGFHIENSTC